MLWALVYTLYIYILYVGNFPLSISVLCERSIFSHIERSNAPCIVLDNSILRCMVEVPLKTRLWGATVLKYLMYSKQFITLVVQYEDDISLSRTLVISFVFGSLKYLHMLLKYLPILSTDSCVRYYILRTYNINNVRPCYNVTWQNNHFPPTHCVIVQQQ